MLVQQCKCIFRRVIFGLVFISMVIIPSIALSSHGNYMHAKFRVTDSLLSRADLDVYPTGLEYTDFAVYNNINLTTHLRVWDARANVVNLVSVYVEPWAIFGSESQSSDSARRTLLGIRNVEPNTSYDWILENEISHRKLATFAINVCNDYIASENRGGNQRRLEWLFTLDHAIALYFRYRVFTAWNASDSTSNYLRGSEMQRVDTHRNIICRKRQNPRAQDNHVPPQSEFIVLHTKIDWLPQIQHRNGRSGECSILAKIEIRTNQPHREISYYVRQQIGHEVNATDVVDGIGYWQGGAYTNHGPYQLETNQNGIAYGRFEAGAGRSVAGGLEIGDLRVVGDSEEFQSPLLSYEMDCEGSRVDIRDIDLNPEVRIPSKRLFKNPSITRPDAPDTRLRHKQESGGFPAGRTLNPGLGLKQYSLPRTPPKTKSMTTDNRKLMKEQELNKVSKQEQRLEKNNGEPLNKPQTSKQLIEKKARPKLMLIDSPSN